MVFAPPVAMLARRKFSLKDFFFHKPILLAGKCFPRYPQGAGAVFVDEPPAFRNAALMSSMHRARDLDCSAQANARHRVGHHRFMLMLLPTSFICLIEPHHLPLSLADRTTASRRLAALATRFITTAWAANFTRSAAAAASTSLQTRSGSVLSRICALEPSAHASVIACSPPA